MLIFLLKVGSFFKLIQVFILSSIKFILAPPVSIEYGYSWIQTILITTIGGILGVLFFYYLSGILLKVIRRFLVKIKPLFAKKNNGLKAMPVPVAPVKRKKVFTRKNKIIIKTRKKYGLWGIALLTPVFLSIPIGSFLANKYYSKNKTVLLTLSISVVCWSLVISSVYMLF